MGLFTGLLTLPLAPVRGVVWIAEQVMEEMERELYDEDSIRRELVQLEPDDGKGWSVTVQVVELSRIPHSTDVLGAYQVTIDQDGEVQAYKRRRRYYRNQADED